MYVKNYHELVVWQKSMDFAEEIYSLVSNLPQKEKYILGDQMRRSVVSIPSNIAEGFGRSSTREYLHFLSIANGSLSELMTQIELCERFGYIKDKEKLELAGNEIGMMLASLMKTLKEREQQTKSTNH